MNFQIKRRASMSIIQDIQWHLTPSNDGKFPVKVVHAGGCELIYADSAEKAEKLAESLWKMDKNAHLPLAIEMEFGRDEKVTKNNILNMMIAAAKKEVQ